MSEAAPWLVCHTRPRCEKKFAALMRAEAFEHYLPLVSSTRRYGTRNRTFTKPLYPSDAAHRPTPCDLGVSLYG